MVERRGIRWGDIALILLLLAGSVGVTLATASRPEGSRAVVTVDGKRAAVLPIGVPGRVEVEGPLGVTVVESDAEGVHIVSSPCPNKICVHMGHARVNGQTILCVPNHVAVRVEGEAGSGIDGVTG